MKFVPSWRCPQLRAAALALAVAGVVGCDPVASSNKDVISKINDGVAKLGKANGYKPVDAVTAAHATLVSAASDKNAYAGFQAIAAASVASLDQGVGHVSAAPFYASIGAARQTLIQLRQLAAQIAITNDMAAGSKDADPKAVQAKVSGAIAAMQGSAQAATWGGDAAKLPTLAAAKQEISRLQGEIAQDQQRAADLTKQRSDAIATSEAQLKHADSLKGDQAVRAFADGSESRRKADDLSIQIDLQQDKLARDQGDLAIQQGQETAVNAGIALLQGHAKQIDAGWTDAQQRAASQTKIAAAAVSGDDADKTSQSIKALSAKLAQQLTEVQQARAAAVDQLAEADKYYATAQQQSQTLIKTFAEKINSPSKESKTYASLKQTVQPQQYTLQMGVVRRDAATMIAAEAALLAEASATKTEVGKILGDAGQTMPAELAGLDPLVASTLASDADTRLGESADMLTNVESGDTPPALKNSAKVAHLITLADRIQLAGLKTALGDTAAKATADGYLTDATALKGDIIAAGLRLPPLPGDLGTPPSAAPIDAPSTPAAPAPGTPAPAAAG